MIVALWLLPLLGAIVCWAFGPQLRTLAGWIASGFVGVSFLLAVASWPAGYAERRRSAGRRSTSDDVAAEFDFGLLLDPLSLLWTFIITGVGFLIVFYSIGYMEGDVAFARFFAYMSFFVFAMLTLVLSDNFVGLLVGWGLVGLASYFLIGFWFQRPSAVAAARKAFVINVVGDVGMMFAIFVIVANVHAIGFGDAFAADGSSQQRRHLDHLRRALHRRGGEIGATAVAYMVAGRYGRPYPGIGPHPCSDDGYRRRLSHRALRAVLERIARRTRTCRHRRWPHGLDRRDPWHGAVGYQTHSRLFDDVADRLHDHGRRRWCV